jgi:cytoskeletal protein CcmA (bactofilin family)
MAMNGQDVSILSEDASLSGRITAQDLTILGGFEGEVNVRGRLRVGPNAKVKAKVKAESVEVEGHFDGEIRSKALSFAPSAHARGLFLADKLGIREGATVEGSFNLQVQSDARPEPRPEPEPIVTVTAPAEEVAPTVVVTPTPPAAQA